MNCIQCGVCCKLFVINLNEEEYGSGRYKTVFEEFGVVEFTEAEMTGANLLAQQEDESCIYLEDGKCSIHDSRPQSCRKFFCDSEDPWFKQMIEKIEKVKSRKVEYK